MWRGGEDDAVAVFNRNTSTGVLTYSAVIKDGATIGGSVVDGLDGATGIVVSPDGKQVYVAGTLKNAVVVFNRDTSTGALAYSTVFKEGTTVGSSVVDELFGACGIAVSPDGERVYVTGFLGDTVSGFNRNISAGVLTYLGAIKDGVGGVDGLEGARGIVVSPDGKNVYVTGSDDDAVVIFNRD